VQPLTPQLAAATGASSGVVVAWVDSDGPASELIFPTDVIEAVNGVSGLSVERWRIRMSRLAAQETVDLRVRRGSQTQTVTLTAADAPARVEAPNLGLTTRHRTGVGVEIVRVDEQSAAAKAGLQPGDVITLFGAISSPTPAQVTAAFAALGDGAALPAAVTRGDDHLIVALVKP
jgi:S1-C subfamily serine protease